MKFKGGLWYKGNVSSIEKGKVGEVVEVGTRYDDGGKEECKWPDKDIFMIDSDNDHGKEKKKKLRRSEVGGEFEEKEFDGERMFYCDEGMCEYYSKW